MDPCVIHDREDKVAGFTLSGCEELVILNLDLVDGFGPDTIQINGIVWIFFRRRRAWWEWVTWRDSAAFDPPRQ